MDAQPAQEVGGETALGGPERVGRPFGTVAVVERDERRLAAHRQPDVLTPQFGVDRAAGSHDAAPSASEYGFVTRGDSNTRRIDITCVERGLALLDLAADRGGARRVGRARERQVAFAGEQAGRGVESNPAGSWQVDLAPGVKVGEILLGPGGTIDRFRVGDELNQVAGHEARGQAQMAKELHEQPRRVAARSRTAVQRLLDGLNARLEADQIADVALQRLRQLDQGVDRAAGRPASRLRQVRAEQRA